MYLFHFFIYNLGGLYHIINQQCNDRKNNSLLLDDKIKIVKMPSNNLIFTIKIYMTNILQFQREVFDIIKYKFELHRPKIKMRHTFYKKIKNLSIYFFGDVKAPLKGVILFDDYNLLMVVVEVETSYKENK
jgi:hypothetical protein